MLLNGFYMLEIWTFCPDKIFMRFWVNIPTCHAGFSNYAGCYGQTYPPSHFISEFTSQPNKVVHVAFIPLNVTVLHMDSKHLVNSKLDIFTSMSEPSDLGELVVWLGCIDVIMLHFVNFQWLKKSWEKVLGSNDQIWSFGWEKVDYDLCSYHAAVCNCLYLKKLMH